MSTESAQAELDRLTALDAAAGEPAHGHRIAELREQIFHDTVMRAMFS